MSLRCVSVAEYHMLASQFVLEQSSVTAPGIRVLPCWSRCTPTTRFGSHILADEVTVADRLQTRVQLTRARGG